VFNKNFPFVKNPEIDDIMWENALESDVSERVIKYNKCAFHAG